MKTTYIHFLGALILSAIGLTSCEKVIDVDIKDSASQLVIEGTVVDNADMQTIKLSRSVAYTEDNTYPPVSGAQVVVTDSRGFEHNYVERLPGVYISSFKGEPTVTYNMLVKVDGKDYTAKSTMPRPVELDSLSVTEVTFGGEDRKIVAVHYKDPAEFVNQYRFVMWVNGIQTRRVYANNDRLTNGNDVKDELFYSSDDDNKEIVDGDAVEIEMQSIDEPMYKYWVTIADQSQNGPGGGVTPGNPPTNVNNNALGYFSAYVSRRKTITIRETGQ
ncbi:DUF4249 domain-containing protein [Mucilaginibacter sp. JRF]|uniref:DUF4249 domain-containing protein n=1 Tax=Mucilaginibacter sp. JRF TaxID=2780088 RepID=UPI0018810BB6|nr:DUF4249 domain-containing protein [Mucilaginibacter sp. JRF]MBE9583401.1 DUF4249 domain-containing protein [Mucilaginibacter sp. JRF]